MVAEDVGFSKFKLLMKESFLILFPLHQGTVENLVKYSVMKTFFALFKTNCVLLFRAKLEAKERAEKKLLLEEEEER